MSSEFDTVSLLVDAGEAKAGGALAPALGPLGLNLGQVVSDINKATMAFKGMKVPIDVVVNKATRKFTISVGLPPASALVLNELGIPKGSQEPGKDFIKDAKLEQIMKVGHTKMGDMLAYNLKSATKEVLGTMTSMGLTCEGEHPRDLVKKINAGEFDDRFAKFEKTL